jgi:HAD superfamily hydrolase (TIGR01509 family)
VIRALLFDFDGLIVDTEGPMLRTWQRIYRDRGHELPLDRWLTIIGTDTSNGFNPLVDLGERTGQTLSSSEVDALEGRYYREEIARQQLLPGVATYLQDARRLGLKRGIASSSTRRWVIEHLERFEIDGAFDAIVCSDDIGRTKPDPQLYLALLERLGVLPAEAIALEDSANGLKAAKAAGAFCVAVPTPLTASTDLSEADLRLTSLDAMPLSQLINVVAGAATR